MRVLRAENDADLAREAAMGLRGAGARVEHADSVSEGRRMARTEDLDVLGLGLSIAQWIASVHDARLLLSSEHGTGMRATVTFPRVSPG